MCVNINPGPYKKLESRVSKKLFFCVPTQNFLKGTAMIWHLGPVGFSSRTVTKSGKLIKSMLSIDL